ncbi:MAG: BTAD domain-containing putative transcriptional regulator [Pseudonocardiales bacterium]
MISIKLLGPVGAAVADRPVKLHGRLGRTLLAALALRTGQVVSVEQVIDACWDDVPPATAREQVHNQVSRLRRAFRETGGADPASSESGGYRLDLPATCVDLNVVRDLRVSAGLQTASGEHAQAAATLRCARAIWIGPALGGVTAAFAAAELPTLERLRLALIEECLAAQLAAGQSADLGPELTALVRAYPLSEPLHRLRMLALYRSGRRAEALAAFREARAVLRRELGIEPAPELRELEAEILREDRGSRPSGRQGPPVPAQVPPRLRHFIGRSAELRRLHDVLAARRADGPPRVAVITGMAGVGKTSVAVQAAAATGGLFPDGQLYVDLRGSDERPLEPFTALGGFLRALGVDGHSQPADLPGRTAEFRTRTAGRTLLVLLDNASDEDQVEPLLAAEPACATLITSRSKLPGLDAPTAVLLSPMPDDLAHRVLVDAAGPTRLDGDPAAARAIVRACGGVPLALRIAGARLAAAPELSAGTLGARLRDSGSLAGLAVGNKSVRGSLDASYQCLPLTHRRALCELARLGPGPFGSWLLAPLLDTSLSEAGHIMEGLGQVNLLESANSSTGYRFHDLVRAYALSVSDPVLEDTAVHRAVDWAVALIGLASPGTERGRAAEVTQSQWRVRCGEDLCEEVARSPREWIEAHWAATLAVFDATVRLGSTTKAAELLAALARPLSRLDLLDQCEAAARRLRQVSADDVPAYATATLTLGRVNTHRGRYHDAAALAEDVLRYVDQIDPATHVDALIVLGGGRAMCEDTGGAMSAFGEALSRAEAMGDPRRQFAARYSLAEVSMRALGDLESAMTHGMGAVALADSCGDPKDRAQARFVVVRLHLARHEVGPAARLATEALELVRLSGDRAGEAWCLLLNADAARANGDLTFAGRAAREAILLARQLQRPDAQASAEAALARTLAAAGDLAGAWAAGERAMELTGEFDSPAERRNVEALLSELAAPPVG